MNTKTNENKLNLPSQESATKPLIVEAVMNTEIEGMIHSTYTDYKISVEPTVPTECKEHIEYTIDEDRILIKKRKPVPDILLNFAKRLFKENIKHKKNLIQQFFS